MTTYRDPMPDPFTQAAVDALAARETREHAREAAWQAGRAEALRAIAAFDVAVAPARLRIVNARGVDGMRTTWTYMVLNCGRRTHHFAYVKWNSSGWTTTDDSSPRTFESILLAAMKVPEFADALAAMQQEGIPRSSWVREPTSLIPTRRTAIHVLGSLGLGLLLCSVCLGLIVFIRHTFPGLFLFG